MRRNPAIGDRVTATNLIRRTSHQRHKSEGKRFFRSHHMRYHYPLKLTLLVWHLVAQGLARRPAAAN
jgi:hypothetical protein